MKLMIIALLFMISSCASYREQKQTRREDCIIKLVREDVSDTVAHIACKDIYEQRPTVK